MFAALTVLARHRRCLERAEHWDVRIQKLFRAASPTLPEQARV
jgi:hypothetical protein